MISHLSCGQSKATQLNGDQSIEIEHSFGSVAWRGEIATKQNELAEKSVKFF